MGTRPGSWEGVFSLLLTPFSTDGGVDFEVYDRYVDWQLSAGPTGLFAVCGSSEMKWLNDRERLELAARAVARAGSVPVVATGNLGPDPEEHCAEIDRMTETGVSGIVLVPPPGMAGEHARFEEYLSSLLEHATIPVFLYEWPQVSPYFIDPGILARLANQYRLAGIKDTTCTKEGILAKVQAVSPDTVVYQANTPFLLESISLGARGMMAITSTAAARLVVKTWEAGVNNAEQAFTLHQSLAYLDAVLRFAYPATAKQLARLQGIPMEVTCRWPLHVADEAVKAVSLWAEFAKRS